jgi:hypothetical protein
VACCVLLDNCGGGGGILPILSTHHLGETPVTLGSDTEELVSRQKRTGRI